MSHPVICIGAALVDELFHAHEEMLLATTNNANVTKTAGGVSRNIAHQLAVLGVPVQLITVVGNDSDGDWLKSSCSQAGVKLDATITKEGLSGKYTGVLSVDGSLFTAFLTNAANDLITPEHLHKNQDLLKTASFLLADANISTASAAWLLNFSKETGIPLILEPVSVPPARKYREVTLDGLFMITPNEDELPVLCQEEEAMTQIQVEELFSRGVNSVWLHNGKQGSVLYTKERALSLHAPSIEVVDCTGAGDGSLSGFLLGKHLSLDDAHCMKLAHTLSAEILQVNGAIATHLTQQSLLNLVPKYYPEA
ncbi:MAG: PfkB family carbohydrate kinase [Chitinophagaceae bacterium]